MFFANSIEKTENANHCVTKYNKYVDEHIPEIIQ